MCTNPEDIQDVEKKLYIFYSLLSVTSEAKWGHGVVLGVLEMKKHSIAPCKNYIQIPQTIS
jgi:hypothetical protein